MGALGDIVLPTKDVSVPTLGQSFSVRGLSFEDISQLFQRHTQVLEDLYQDFAAGGEAFDASALAHLLVQTAPELVAEGIALAGGEGEWESDLKIARKLPMPVQLEAVGDILSLTFHSEEEVKKSLEMVIASSMTLKNLIQSLTSRPEISPPQDEPGSGTDDKT